MTFLDEGVGDYLTGLAEAAHRDPVLDEMEAYAAERGFPIVGRAVGRLLEVIARAVGARRVMELGSGFGYSAYWFARAVGEGGEVVCSDGDEDNAGRAAAYLAAAGLDARVRFHVGDALEVLAAQPGDFDLVYCDVDKHGYPDAWNAARHRVRVGGMYVCDNVLWYGLVVTGQDRSPRFRGWTAAVQEHNRLVASDEGYVSSIVPLRDGVTLALRVS